MDERVERTEPEVEPAPLIARHQGRPPALVYVAWSSSLFCSPRVLGSVGISGPTTWRIPPPWWRRTRRADPSAGRLVPATIDKGDIRIIQNELGTVTSLDHRDRSGRRSAAN